MYLSVLEACNRFGLAYLELLKLLHGGGKTWAPVLLTWFAPHNLLG